MNNCFGIVKNNTASLVLLFLIVLSSCSDPLDKVFSEITISEDIYAIKQNDSLVSELIKEQVEFDNYNGFTYRQILSEFDNRVKKAEEILDRVYQLDSIRDVDHRSIDWMSLNEFDIFSVGGNYITGKGNIITNRNVKLGTGSIRLIPKQGKNNNGLCYELDIDFGKNIYIGLNQYKSGDLIPISRTSYTKTYECSLLLSDYEDPIIRLEYYISDDGEVHYWSRINDQLEYRFKNLGKILTANVILKIWEKRNKFKGESILSNKEKFNLAIESTKYYGGEFNVHTYTEIF